MTTKNAFYCIIFIVACVLVFKVLPFLFLVVVGLGILALGTAGWYKLGVSSDKKPKL